MAIQFGSAPILPNLTADPTGAEGMAYFNTDIKAVKLYRDGAWVRLDEVQPTTDNLFLAETYDLGMGNGSGAMPTAAIKGTKVWIYAGRTFTTLHTFNASTAGVSLTHTYAGIYSLAGSKLAESTTSLTSTTANSLVTFTLSSTWTAPSSGWYNFVVQVGGAGTPPTFVKGPIQGATNSLNGGTGSGTYRVFSATGSNGALPSSLSGIATNEDRLWWIGGK